MDIKDLRENIAREVDNFTETIIFYLDENKSDFLFEIIGQIFKEEFNDLVNEIVTMKEEEEEIDCDTCPYSADCLDGIRCRIYG